MSVELQLRVPDVIADVDSIDLQEQARIRREQIELFLLSVATGLSVVLVSCVWVMIALA